MPFNMLIISFSVLMISKVTLGKTDCENYPFDVCDRLEVNKGVPTKVEDFDNFCLAYKSYMKCLNEWQNECGSDRFVFFETPEIFQATYDTLSDICEEGTLFNTVVTENLKCLNETFEKTLCQEATYEFLNYALNENEGSETKLSFFCLESTLVTDCLLRELSNGCGKLVGEASLEIFFRSKTLENVCSVKEARLVLDELHSLGLDEETKNAVTKLLGKLLE